MISIFILYSPDRKEYFEKQLHCLEQMEWYVDCQKILVVDGDFNIKPKDFKLIRVERVDNEYCWGLAWETGVNSCDNPIVLYLDCDRLLPYTFLNYIKGVKQDTFYYTSQHFIIKKYNEEIVNKTLNPNDLNGKLNIFQKYTEYFQYEPKMSAPPSWSCKNPMSGCTAFRKDTFLKTKEMGLVDYWYCGHGAHFDLDYFMACYRNGFNFQDIPVVELHFDHPKKVDEQSLSKHELGILGLINFEYYCTKWNIDPVKVAEMRQKIT